MLTRATWTRKGWNRSGKGKGETHRPLNLHLVIGPFPLLLPSQPRNLRPHPAAPPYLLLDVLAHLGDGGGALGLEVAVERRDLRRGGGGAGEERGELAGRDDCAEVGGEEEVVCQDGGFGWRGHFRVWSGFGEAARKWASAWLCGGVVGGGR